jgi:hypothetical protein
MENIIKYVRGQAGMLNKSYSNLEDTVSVNRSQMNLSPEIAQESNNGEATS